MVFVIEGQARLGHLELVPGETVVVPACAGGVELEATEAMRAGIAAAEPMG